MNPWGRCIYNAHRHTRRHINTNRRTHKIQINTSEEEPVKGLDRVHLQQRPKWNQWGQSRGAWMLQNYGILDLPYIVLILKNPPGGVPGRNDGSEGRGPRNKDTWCYASGPFGHMVLHFRFLHFCSFLGTTTTPCFLHHFLWFFFKGLDHYDLVTQRRQSKRPR